MALDATGSSGAAQGAAGNNYLSSAEEFKRVCPFAVAAEILELCKVLAEILALPTGFLGIFVSYHCGVRKVFFHFQCSPLNCSLLNKIFSF